MAGLLVLASVANLALGRSLQGNSQKLSASKLFEIVPDIWLFLDKLNLWNHVTSRRYAAAADDFGHAAAVSENNGGVQHCPAQEGMDSGQL